MFPAPCLNECHEELRQFMKAREIPFSPVLWVKSPLYGCILSWKSKSIPTHWIQHLQTQVGKSVPEVTGEIQILKSQVLLLNVYLAFRENVTAVYFSVIVYEQPALNKALCPQRS